MLSSSWIVFLPPPSETSLTVEHKPGLSGPIPNFSTGNLDISIIEAQCVSQLLSLRQPTCLPTWYDERQSVHVRKSDETGFGPFMLQLAGFASLPEHQKDPTDPYNFRIC